MWNFAIANCDLPETFVYGVVDAVMSDNERMVNIHRAARSTLPENWDKKRRDRGIPVRRAGSRKKPAPTSQPT
jgi:hypothetical protein